MVINVHDASFSIQGNYGFKMFMTFFLVNNKLVPRLTKSSPARLDSMLHFYYGLRRPTRGGTMNVRWMNCVVSLWRKS